jgi:putative transposase
MVEQDHHGVKRVTRPMLGFKSFAAAHNTLAGIELMHMMKKGQMAVKAGDEDLTAADQFYALAPLLGETLRKRRYGTVGASWYVDETYVRVDGRWQYLYRVIDRDRNLVDVRLSDTRDLAAAEAFFRSAWAVTGVIPDRITTDGHDAYPRAIRNVFGDRVLHRTNRYLNNHLEQDHRGIKQRYRPMGGFKHGITAARFCRLFDEARAFLRPLSYRNQPLSLQQRRATHQEQFAQLMSLMATA